MTTIAPPRYLRVAAAARQLQLSVHTVRSLFDRGILSGIRTTTGQRLIEIASINAYIETRFLSVSEAARRLDVSRETVMKRFDSGELAGHRSPAGHRLIDPSSLSC